MASMNSPFVDPEVDKTLPPLPATLSRRQESRIMSSQPVTSYQPSNNLRVQNPFADPLVEDKSKSASPATSSVPDSSSPGAGSGTQGTIPHARVAARDLTSEMASDSLPVDLKPSSAMSTASSAPFSSRTGITTLISSTHGGAISSIADRNAFAETRAPARVQDRGQAGNGTGPSTPLPKSIYTPIYNHYTLPVVLSDRPGLTPSLDSSIAPTPPPKSPLGRLGPLGSNRWNSVTAISDRISLKLHLQSSDPINSLAARQAVALESAQRQYALLAIERARASTSQTNVNEPHLHPSLSVTRLAADLVRAYDEKNRYRSYIAVLTCSPFWIGVVWFHCGLLSTVASVSVLITEKQHGSEIKMGKGEVFWLIASLAVMVVGGFVVVSLWLKKRRVGFIGGAQSILRRLGCDEVGLLDRAVVRDVEMGRMEADADADGKGEHIGSAPSPDQSLRQRPRGPIPSPDSFRSVRTGDPRWQPMYSQPQQIKKTVSWETIGDTPVRRGAYGLHKHSNLARDYNEQRSNATLRMTQPKQKNHQLASSSRQPSAHEQHFNDQNRRYKGQTPPVSRRGAYGLHKHSNLARDYNEQRSNATLRMTQPKQKNHQLASSSRQPSAHEQHFNDQNRRYKGQTPPVSRGQAGFENQALTRSDISWPLRSLPDARPFVNIHPEYPSYQDHSSTSHQGLQQQYPTKPSRNHCVASSSSTRPSANSNTINTEPHKHLRIGTESRVEVVSPLSSLAQIAHKVSQSSSPPQNHSEYIHNHRVASEGRIRTLRHSLDQCHNTGRSVTRDLSRIQSSTPSAATDRLRTYVAETGDESEEEERVGRPRSRSVRVVLESGSDLDVSVEEKGVEAHHQDIAEVLTN